jgi:hypothetical protein
MTVTTSFPDDSEHASWDHDAVTRFGRVLDWSDSVFEEFSGWFNGKTSPVHFFWHGFDRHRHALFVAAERKLEQRSRDAGGVFARGDLVWLLARRRAHAP